jgi:hypothetical protein
MNILFPLCDQQTPRGGSGYYLVWPFPVPLVPMRRMGMLLWLRCSRFAVWLSIG